jgi:hypothetical protein
LRGRVGFDQPFRQRQHQKNGVLGSVLDRAPRQARHQNAALRGGLEINAVGPRADALDQLEFRIGVHQRGVDVAAAENKDRYIAAFAQVELLRCRNERHAVDFIQSASGSTDLRRLHLLGQEKVARPLIGNLGRAQCVAGEADDVIVVENCDFDRGVHGRSTVSSCAIGDDF